MKRIALLILLCSLSVISACDTSLYTLTNNEKMYSAAKETSVRVTTNETIAGQPVEVGYVFASGSSIEASIDNLKKKAAELGGTGVIRLQTTVIRTYIMILIIPIPVDHFYSQGVVVKS